MLVLFIASALFSTGVLCEGTIELEQDIPYVPIAIYKFSKDIVTELDSGRPVETFDDVAYDDMLSRSRICEVHSKEYRDNGVIHTPALCSQWCYIQSTPTGNALCKRTYSDRELCCPADQLPFYSAFPHVSVQHEPSFQYIEHNISIDWSRVDHVVPGRFRYYDGFYKENEKDAIKDFQQDNLCGVKKLNEKDYALFFCVPSDSCIAPKHNDSGPYIAEPVWSEFCNIFSNNQVPHTCCHPNYFPRDKFSGGEREYYNLVFQKVPNFVKYPVGFRSSFMCEAYSRFVCNVTNHGAPDRNSEQCRSPDNRTPRPNNLNDAISLDDAPYIARLGVVAPNLVVFHCLGSIVSHRYILSVYACKKKNGIQTNVVMIGEEDTDNLSEDLNDHYEALYMISRILKVLHGHNKPTLYRTSRDMEFSPKRRPACLYYKPTFKWPYEADVPYFGRLKDDEYEGRFLRMQTMPLHGPNEKNEFEKFCGKPDSFQLDNLNIGYKEKGADPEWEFCGGFTSGQQNGPCKFDRGSPMAVKMKAPYCSFQILGVLTTERWKCDQDTRPVFANITKYLEAIEDIIWPQPFHLSMTLPKPDCVFPRIGAPVLWKGFAEDK